MGLAIGTRNCSIFAVGLDVALPEHVIVRSVQGCLLYTSDAADERSSVDLGGRRIIKKKKNQKKKQKKKQRHKIKSHRLHREPAQ